MVTCPKGVSAVHISRPLPKAGDKKIGQSHVSAQYGVSVQIPQSFFFSIPYLTSICITNLYNKIIILTTLINYYA